jgi:hypothetical protein
LFIQCVGQEGEPEIPSESSPVVGGVYKECSVEATAQLRPVLWYRPTLLCWCPSDRDLDSSV